MDIEQIPLDDVVELLISRSLLGLLLTRESIEQLIAEFPVRTVAKGTFLCREGEIASSLIIVTAGKAELGSQNQSIKMGDVSGGRSVNLHSVVRKLPYQYDAITESECSFVEVPWEKITHAFHGNPKLQTYLEIITSSPDARRISKDIDSAGCSSLFRVNLIGSLVEKKLAAQQWLVQQGEIPKFSFFHLDGSIHTFQSKEKGPSVPLWDVPKLAWHLWSETLNAKPAHYSLRTLTESRFLQIKDADLTALNEEFSEDLKQFSSWLLQTDSRAPAEENEESEDVDSLIDLFPQEHLNQTGQGKKFPFIQQYNQMDCGPACLAMISKYYGNDLPIQFWRDQVGANREGASLFDIAAAAEKNGFIAHGISIETPADLEAQLLPCIALRQYHFIVIYELKGDKITIGDPGEGIVEVTTEAFLEGFENAVLLLKPGAEFHDIDVPLKGSSHYLQLFSGYGREAGLVFLCSALLVLFSLFPPILSQLILDEVLSKKDSKLLFVVLGAGVLIAISRGFLSWIRSYYLSYITTKFDFRANSGFIRKMFSLPYSFFATRHVGDFTRRLTEMERVRVFFTNTLITVVIDLVTLVFYAMILFSYSPKIAVMTFALAPILVGISMFFAKRLRKAYSESFLVHTDVESILTDQIKGIATIKTMGAELAGRWRYEEKLVKALKADYSFALNASAMGAAAESYNQIARFLLMGYSAYLGIQGELSPGQVVALSMIVNSVIDPFNSLAHAWSGVQEIKVILDRLNDIFLSPSEESSKKKKLTKDKISGEIEFRDVWFRYGGDSSDWILKGLSFKIDIGQNVAIVGESGSGKSTIAYLLSRMYEAQKGQILIDGRDIRDYDLQWLRKQVGLLHQESNLFHGSIAENIAFGSPRFDSNDVIKAAKMADAHDFIEKKNNGFDYRIAHGGLGLSGGEKQRISLARTVFTGASVLVLDEATSALDGISEKKLLESIKLNFKGMTILSIAHRYTTVKMSDFALVIAGGRCMGFGTHEQLSRDNHVYARLFGFAEKNEEKGDNLGIAS